MKESTAVLGEGGRDSKVNGPSVRPIIARVANATLGKKRRKMVLPTLDPKGPRSLQSRLLIQGTLQSSSGPEVEVRILIDTGSQVDLVRSGLMPASSFSLFKNPLQLWAANQGQMEGGKLDTIATLRLNGFESEQKTKVSIITPTTLYQADMEDDVILSFAWLASRGFNVDTGQHEIGRAHV